MTKKMIDPYRIYQRYRYLRHEGCTVNDCIRLIRIPVKPLFAILAHYRRDWIEDLKNSSLTDLQIVRLVWGCVEGKDLIDCENWVASIRADSKGRSTRG